MFGSFEPASSRTVGSRPGYTRRMKILKRVLIGVAILGAAILLAGVYLLGSEAVPETTDYALDIPGLRALAHDSTGELPIAVRYEIIAMGELARAFVMAGEDFSPVEMPRPVFQVLYPDGTYVLIDSAYDRTLHEQGGAGTPFYDDAWDKLVVVMEGAEQIVVTHEHGDHLGGVLKHPRRERLVRSLRLSEEQLSSRGEIFAVLPDSFQAKLDPLVYDDAVAIAPGVALKKAAGHTPGSQMVFVTLASGSELLFVGDVVWNLDAVTELIYRPRLVTDYFLGENRAAVLGQIRALRNLYDSGTVPIVVSHDRRTFDQPGIEEGFALESM